MSVIISHTLDTLFIWLCLAFHYLCTFYPEIKELLFHFLSTRVHPHIMFFQTALHSQDSLQSLSCQQQSPLYFWSPPTSADTIIPGWEALVVPPQLFWAINASTPICALRGGEEREKEDVSREWDEIPLLLFVKGEERAVIITLEALDCNFSPQCVNLCIHQVFTGLLCK